MTRHPRLALAAAVLAAGCQPSPATPPSGAAPAPSRYALAAAPTITATHSSGAFVAARAIDGNPDTEWQSGAVSYPALTLDRGGPGTLTALDLKARPNQAFHVDVSDDGAAWRQVLASQRTTTWGIERKALPAGTSGRYVRVRYATTGVTVMVFELQPVGTLATPAPSAAPTAAPTATPTAAPSVAPSVAPSAGAPGASATHTNGTYVAARAVDGNPDTEWQSGVASYPALTYDRGTAGAVTALDIKAKPGQAYHVDVSDDGAAWRQVLASQQNATWGVERKVMPAGAGGRYVRVRYATTGVNVMLFELVVVGGTATPSPTPAPTSAPTATPTAAPTVAPTPIAGAVATRYGNQSVPRSSDGTHTRGYQLIEELGMTTIREGWNWRNLQPSKGSYVSWLGAYTDPKTAKLASLGLATEAMVCDTPDWATSDASAPQKRYTVPAGLALAMFADGTDVYKPGVGPNPDNYFATYMFDMASRYKGQVASWQVWNEPDFPTGDLGKGYTGTNGNTRYWTGTVQEYVRLLKVAHTVVKGVDPAARIALGGLGYEKYLAAILDNGGAPYFDIVDFHAYGTDKTSANGVLNSAWGLMGRYQAMKGVMAARGVTGKTFAVSETGMTADKPEEQAGYAAKVLATGLGLGDVELVQWAVFTNPGHLNIGLIDQATLSQKTKGYLAYTFTTKQLAGCRAAGALTGGGVQGWKFVRPDGRARWLAWSTTATATVSLPAMSGRVLDKYGATRNASFGGGSLALTPDPVWVEE